MRRLIVIVAVMVMTLFAVPVMALTGIEGCPDGNPYAFQPNPIDPNFPKQNECIGRLELSDFGHFDNGVFIWDGPEYVGFDTWMDNAGQIDWETSHTPTSGFQVQDTRFDIINAEGSGQLSRVIVRGGQATTYPLVWKVKGPNGETEGYYMANFMPPERCTDDSPYMDNNLCVQDWPQYSDVQTYGTCDNAVEQFCGTYDESGIPQCDPGPPETKCSPESQLYSCYDLFELSFTPTEVCSPMLWWRVGDPTMNSDPDVDPCCKLWTQMEMRTEVSGYVTHTDYLSAELNGEVVGPRGTYYSDTRFYRYEMGVNDFVYGGEWNEADMPMVYFLNFSQVPEVGPITVKFTLKDGSTFTHDYYVENNDVLPTVPANIVSTVIQNVVNRSGKTVRGLSGQEVQVVTPNLVARELNGSLVIQWSEPDGALNRPYLKLRMYIGNGWGTGFGGSSIDTGRLDTFLFLDCPPQSGTVVVPAYIWGPFKTELQGLGDSEVSIAGMYRYQYRNGNTGFDNRGYFDSIQFPFQ